MHRGYPLVGVVYNVKASIGWRLCLSVCPYLSVYYLIQRFTVLYTSIMYNIIYCVQLEKVREELNEVRIVAEKK